MKNNYAKNIRILLISTLIIWIATYSAGIRDYYLDIAQHTPWALTITRSNLFEFMTNYVAYPLWHLFVRLFTEWFPYSPLNTAAGVTALFNCFALWSVMFVWNRLSKHTMEFGNVAFYSTILLFIGPLSLPSFNPFYYLGQGSGNVWHNPTNIAVKGFAVLCFFLIIYILESTKTDRELLWTYVILGALLLMSALAKPSFFQGIVPGLGLYFIFALIFKGFKKHIKRFILIAVSFIPSACVIGFQFFSSFFMRSNIAEGDGIGIEFGRVLHNWSPNLAISFLLAFAFPLAVLLLNFKTLIRQTSVQVVLFYELAAWAESTFLYEVGTRELHGNWLWGSYLSMFIVWMFFLIKYFDILHDEETTPIKKKVNCIIVLPLLFLQLLFGIAFWYSFSSFV